MMDPRYVFEHIRFPRHFNQLVLKSLSHMSSVAAGGGGGGYDACGGQAGAARAAAVNLYAAHAAAAAAANSFRLQQHRVPIYAALQPGLRKFTML